MEPVVELLADRDLVTQVAQSGDDHVQRAEEALGLREPEDNSPLAPDVCDVCENNLEPNAKACSRCGTVFTPDAKSAEAQIEQDMKDSYREVDPEDMDTQEKVDAIDDLLDDPEVKSVLLEKIGEE